MFHRCETSEDVKKLFKRLAHYFHPDKGGEPDLMILLRESYEMAFSLKKNLENPNREKQENSQGWYQIFKEKAENLKYNMTEVDENFINEGDDKLEIIEEIKKYAEAHSKFDVSWTLGIQEYLLEKGKITSAQYNSLVKVYYAFQMHKE